MSTYIKTLKDNDNNIVYPQSTAEAIQRQIVNGNTNSSTTVEASLETIESQLQTMASQSYVGQQIATIINSSPKTLQTLKDLADALGGDANFSATIMDLLGDKANSADLGTAAYSNVESTGIISNTSTLPTTAQVKTYVDANSGQVNNIIIDGVTQSVINGNVTLNLEDYIKTFDVGTAVDPNPINATTLNGYSYTQIVNAAKTSVTQSTTNETLYIAGYDTTNNAIQYNTNVYFNPSTGYLTATKVYNAVYNDYAEWFEKADFEEKFEPGDVCIWTVDGVKKSFKKNDKAAIGVVSNTYGHILGGEDLDNMEKNNEKFVPIGLSGRVNVKIIGKVEIGDLIVSAENGCGIVNNNATPEKIIGKALNNSYEEGIKLVQILI